MMVILGEDQYDEWLKASAGKSMDFMRLYPTEWHVVNGEPVRGRG